MYQENEMLLPVTAAFCAEEEKKKTAAPTVALINDSVFVCMLGKKGALMKMHWPDYLWG